MASPRFTGNRATCLFVRAAGKGIRADSQGNARSLAPVTGHPRRWRPMTLSAKGNRQPDAASPTAVAGHRVAHTAEQTARTRQRVRRQGIGTQLQGI